MLNVYIAGPYSADTEEGVGKNVKYAIQQGNKIAELGYIVYIPHLAWLWEQQFKHPHNFWIEQDQGWLDRADVLVRLKGNSKGADMEMERADAMGLLIYTEDEFFADPPREDLDMRDLV